MCTTERGTWQLGQWGGSERGMRCPCVTNVETSQDHLSVSGPLCGGAPSVHGGLNQGQLTVGSQASVPAGCQDSRIARDRGLEEAGTMYRKGEDWPVWPRGPPFHCQAIPRGKGPNRKKLLCGGIGARLGSVVFSRPERAGCISSRGLEGHYGSPSK